MGQGLILLRNRRRACRGGPDGRLTGWRTQGWTALYGRRNTRRRAGRRPDFQGRIDDQPGRCRRRHGALRHRKACERKAHETGTSDIPRLRGIEQPLAQLVDFAGQLGRDRHIA
ncbi:hypothetical protein DF018_06410 [Burkholderia cenocepacia]|nr:hypothetical protein DF132_30425 [Burkholderia cenocepacia]RQV73257.1 hypothetical protein DF018_06410 [Burkholderia cenocepacia]